MSEWKQTLWEHMRRCAGVGPDEPFEFEIRYRGKPLPMIGDVRVRPEQGQLRVPVDDHVRAASEHVDEPRLFRSVNQTGRKLYENARKILRASTGESISLNQFQTAVAVPLAVPDALTIAGNVYSEFHLTPTTIERCFTPEEAAKLKALPSPRLYLAGHLVVGDPLPVTEVTAEGADETSEDEAHDDEVAARNVIVFGPPGTGKRHRVKQRIQAHLGKRGDDANAVVRVTFHPETTYFDFVGTERPVVGWLRTEAEFAEAAGGLRRAEPRTYYEFVPGPFARAVALASHAAHPVALVIEEINRGNCAAIFGDVFQLLDRDDGGWSTYPIDVEPTFAAWLERSARRGAGVFEGTRLRLPPNLFLYATMNTSDQSLFAMDTAFKRRWSMEYVSVDEHGQVGARLKAEGRTLEWTAFLRILNAEIVDFTRRDDKQVGPWFLKARDGQMAPREVASKLLHYLWDDVFREQPDRVFSAEIRTFGALRAKYEAGDQVFSAALRQRLAAVT